jgi:hypothetical protein
MPDGNWNAKPSAVTHGVWRHVPDWPPQSASLLQNCNALVVELVMHTFGPVVPNSW